MLQSTSPGVTLSASPLRDGDLLPPRLHQPVPIAGELPRTVWLAGLITVVSSLTRAFWAAPTRSPRQSRTSSKSFDPAVARPARLVLLQGIEPWSSGFQPSALPLSYRGVVVGGLSLVSLLTEVGTQINHTGLIIRNASVANWVG